MCVNKQVPFLLSGCSCFLTSITLCSLKGHDIEIVHSFLTTDSELIVVLCGRIQREWRLCVHSRRSDVFCLKIFGLRDPVCHHNKDCFLLSGVMWTVPSPWQAHSFLCNDALVRTQQLPFVVRCGFSLDSCTYLAQNFLYWRCSVSITWIIDRDSCNSEVRNMCFHECFHSLSLSNHPWPKASVHFQYNRHILIWSAKLILRQKWGRIKRKEMKKNCWGT